MRVQRFGLRNPVHKQWTCRSQVLSGTTLLVVSESISLAGSFARSFLSMSAFRAMVMFSHGEGAGGVLGEACLPCEL